MKKIIFSMTIFAFALLATCGKAQNKISEVTVLTEVFGNGQKVTAAIVEYDKAIKNSGLSVNDFSVEDRTITKVYANDSAAKSSIGRDGKYVVIELSPDDELAPTFYQDAGKTTRRDASVSIRQLSAIKSVDGVSAPLTAEYIESTRQINLVVDDFIQGAYTYNPTGDTLQYNLFIPKDYDPAKSYPLVLFMHDAGATSANVLTTLIQGNGAIVWATPDEQARRPCFVLAPQYEVQIVNDNSEATGHLDMTIDLIKDLMKEYSIDENRLYTTGQSGGCMMSIAMNIKYPDFFAASYLVAGQWDASLVAPMANDNLWITVSEGDTKAFPGMNAITSALEKAGARVSRAVWDGQSTPEEFELEVNKILAEDSNVKYVTFKLGTTIPEALRSQTRRGNEHRGTWQIAYNIEGIREWLFEQTLSTYPLQIN